MDLKIIHPCVDVMDDGDEVFIDKDGLSNSSKYLIRKIQGRLRRLQRDLQIVIVEVNYWKLRVRQIIQESHEAAEKILMVGNEDIEKVLKQLKKVTRIMGSSDTEITLMKASLSNFHNLVSDEVEDDSSCVSSEQPLPYSKAEIKSETAELVFTTNLLSDIDIGSSASSGPSILNSEGPRQQISVKTPHFVEIDLPECWVGRLLPIKQYYKYDHLKHIESKHGVVIQVRSINLL